MITVFFSLLFWLANGSCTEGPGLKLFISNFVDSESELPEASDIVRVGNFYYLVMDDSCFLGKVSTSTAEISSITSDGACGGKSDFEAMFRLPGDTDDENPTFIVCGEDTLFCNEVMISDSTYVTVEHPVTDGGEGCHDDVRWGKNKGIEGAVGFEGEDGNIYMLALIEGTGKIITYLLQDETWISQSCVKVPVKMRDYSSLGYYSTSEGTVVAVTSQKGRKLWIGMAEGISMEGRLIGPSEFNLQEGTTYDFPKAYRGIEGVFIENYDPTTGEMDGVFASDDQAGTGPYANAVHQFSLRCEELLTRVNIPKIIDSNLEEGQESKSQSPSVSTWSLLCGVIGIAGFLLGFGLTYFVKKRTQEETSIKCEATTSSMPQFEAVLLPAISGEA